MTTGAAAKVGGTASGGTESGGRHPGHGMKLPRTGRAGRRQKGERGQDGYGAARARRAKPVPHPLAASAPTSTQNYEQSQNTSE